MCVVRSSRWQCVLLGFLGGKLSFFAFLKSKCVAVSFRWQADLLGVLGGNVYCMF